MQDLPVRRRIVEVLCRCSDPTGWRYGSGFLIWGRIVLTSAHVVSSCDEVWVRSISAQQYGTKDEWRANVKILGDPAVADLALLELEDSDPEIAMARLAFI